MAQIVCIDTGTLRSNCEIDDIVSIHDDDVELGGKGYEFFQIYKIENVTAAEVQDKLNSLIPEQKESFRLDADRLKWTHNQPERIETWKNTDDKWCQVIERPKYAITMASLVAKDKEDLASKEVTKEASILILGKCSEKIHLDSKNNIEVADLNLVKL